MNVLTVAHESITSLHFHRTHTHTSIDKMSSADTDSYQSAIVKFDCAQYAQYASTAILAAQKARGQRKAIPRQNVLDAVCQLILELRPETEYAPKEERTDYSKHPDSVADCDNPDCKNKCRGGKLHVRCKDCGFGAYCSVRCCSADRTYHVQVMCVGTVNHAIRLVPGRLMDILSYYLDHVRDTLPSLKFNEWLEPIDPDDVRLVKETPDIVNYGLWLKYRLAYEYLGKFTLSGLKSETIPCARCGTAIEFDGLSQLEWDLRDHFDEEKSPQQADGAALRKKINACIKVSLLGVTDGGHVKLRFSTFCSARCHDRFDFLQDDFVDGLFYADPMNGNPALYLELRTIRGEGGKLSALLEQMKISS